MTNPLSAGTRGALRRALQAIDGGHRGDAVAIARTLAGDVDRGAVLVGARLLFLLRLYDEALAALRARLAADPGDDYVQRLHFAWLKRLHFEAEAETTLAALLGRSDDVHTHEAAVVHYQGTDRPREALAHLDVVLRTSPPVAHRYRARWRLAWRRALKARASRCRATRQFQCSQPSSAET